MSTWSVRELACPHCGATIRTRVALGVHIGRVPQVREDILARTFHRAKCTCGHEVAIDTSFEYTDLERGQLVLVGPESQRAQWETWEQRLREIVHRVVDLGSPLVHDIVKRVTARVVFGLEELREKLVVWQVAMDDSLVEVVKVRLIAADPTLAAPGSRLVVDEVEADDAIVCNWLPADGAARRVAAPASWIHEAEHQRDALAARFPELADGYVNVAKLR